MTDETIVMPPMPEVTLTPTEPVPEFLLTPVVTETQTPAPAVENVEAVVAPMVVEQASIQPTMQPTETLPATGASLSEHPAVGILEEIEAHLTSLSLYGSVENSIRKLVQDLKAFF